MKHILTSVFIAASIAVVANAATPEQEKAFVASYRKAFEAGDKAALEKFLYTKGAEPDQIEFFKMMMMPEKGTKITKIELVKPTAEEMAKFNEPMEMPDGKKYKMPFNPTYALVIETETKTGDSSSTSKARQPVGEKDGKLVIPVPVAASAAAAKPGAPAKPAPKKN